MSDRTTARPEALPEGPEAIRVDHLTKRFGTLAAVEDVSFTVGPGEIFGFLGPNGAGKTTTIRMLAGLLKPDAGEIRIRGRDFASDPISCKRVTGFIPDRPFLYEKLTGIEFLEFMASLYGVAPESFTRGVFPLLSLFGLDDRRDHLIESYSHGMKQKLIMISALIHDPPIIIVDEPMVGLDPRSARLVKEVFKQRAREGGTIFLSTHSLEVAEELCGRIAIIVGGRIRSVGDLGALRREARMADSSLEEIFLELTGSFELRETIAALQAGGERV